MQLIDLLKNVEIKTHGVSLSLDVADIASDSRRIKDGVKTLFFAYQGVDFDSHAIAEKLYQQGKISAAVTERPLKNIPCIVTESGRRAFALACANFFGHPEKDMITIGVTGTNGKTTITYLLESIFNATGKNTVRIGTNGANVAGTFVQINNTTPSAYDFYKFLRDGSDKGAKAAIAEVSSHALAQDRLYGMVFDAAVFTNLTAEHQDYHKDIEDYYRAKKLLFDVDRSRKQIINVTHAVGKRLYQESEGERYRYGVNRESDFMLGEYSLSSDGVGAEICFQNFCYKYSSCLVGEYNLENILAAVSTAIVLGLPIAATQRGVSDLKNIPGRLEKYASGGVMVFVDYAHTPDALKNAVSAIRKLCRGRVITVFGAGGDRDKLKRQPMGKLAQELSDVVVVTNDNPRTEDPKAIIDEILSGMNTTDNVYVKPDRAEAIAFAIQQAEEGDMVLVAGKGHEDYQIIGNIKYPFSDSVQVKRALGLDEGYNYANR